MRACNIRLSDRHRSIWEDLARLSGRTKMDTLRTLLEVAHVSATEEDGKWFSMPTNTTVRDLFAAVIPGLQEALGRISKKARALGVEWPIPHTGDPENEYEIYKRVLAALKRDVILHAEESENEKAFELAGFVDALYRMDPRELVKKEE